MKRIGLGVLLAALLPLTAAAQSVTPSRVTTSGISRLSPAHYVNIPIPWFNTSASGPVARLLYPGPGKAKLVNIFMFQNSAGTGGTLWQMSVRNAAGTALVSTVGMLTLAAGANVGVDALGYVGLPAGCTRPVIKTDGTQIVSAGDYLDVYATESGTYSPHAVAVALLVFEPMQ